MEFNELKGKTLIGIDVDTNLGEILFTDTENRKYILHHEQDCCESVMIEDINGDISDLINTPIIVAEERTSTIKSKTEALQDLLEGKPQHKQMDDDELWTFYEIRTIKGSVTIRWFGESNGYYAISVNFNEIIDENIKW